MWWDPNIGTSKSAGEFPSLIQREAHAKSLTIGFGGSTNPPQMIQRPSTGSMAPFGRREPKDSGCGIPGRVESFGLPKLGCFSRWPRSKADDLSEIERPPRIFRASSICGVLRNSWVADSFWGNPPKSANESLWSISLRPTLYSSLEARTHGTLLRAWPDIQITFGTPGCDRNEWDLGMGCSPERSQVPGWWWLVAIHWHFSQKYWNSSLNRQLLMIVREFPIYWHIGLLIIPIDELIFFRVAKNHQPDTPQIPLRVL